LTVSGKPWSFEDGVEASCEGTNGDCPAGTVETTALHGVFFEAECQDCAAGTARSDGQDQCGLCSPGTFSAAGASECTPCAAGNYSAAGEMACTRCPPGEFTAAEGQSSCTLASAGYPSGVE